MYELVVQFTGNNTQIAEKLTVVRKIALGVSVQESCSLPPLPRHVGYVYRPNVSII